MEEACGPQGFFSREAAKSMKIKEPDVFPGPELFARVPDRRNYRLQTEFIILLRSRLRVKGSRAGRGTGSAQWDQFQAVVALSA